MDPARLVWPGLGGSMGSEQCHARDPAEAVCNSCPAHGHCVDRRLNTDPAVEDGRGVCTADKSAIAFSYSRFAMLATECSTLMLSADHDMSLFLISACERCLCAEIEAFDEFRMCTARALTLCADSVPHGEEHGYRRSAGTVTIHKRDGPGALVRVVRQLQVQSPRAAAKPSAVPRRRTPHRGASCSVRSHVQVNCS